MLFNSPEFLVFFLIVFIGYWFPLRKSLKAQNLFILISSYVFYGWWDWRFLSLILFSSIVDYVVGISIFKSEGKKRKTLLLISIFSNVGILGLFKYFNFFAESLSLFISNLFGYQLNDLTLDVILPVGISFYTFQTMSYTIDIYNRKLEPTKDIVSFFAYVSFFPQLVAGPIERASNLLPQFLNRRVFSYDEGSKGLRQILWGLFKKIVIADNCAIWVDKIFGSHESLPASVLLAGSIYFAFQIYGDFSGYSDIAIGTGRLLGFKLQVNFRTPYFSRDIAEFWRRWHISLSSWFRDYVYIPLGGSKETKFKSIRNIFIIFIVSGLWHGANWTFIIWGGLNALYFLPLFLLNINRRNLNIVSESRMLPYIGDIISILITFFLVCFSWIFFRSTDLAHAFSYITAMFTNQIFPTGFYYFQPLIIILLSFFVLLEWLLFRHDDFLNRISKLPIFLRFSGYLVIITLTIFFMPNESKSFIYFQF